MKTIEQFLNAVISNKELAEKLAGISDEQKLGEFLKENEVDCTTEQFKALMIEIAKQSGEIPEEELDAVAGGSVLGQIAAIALPVWSQNLQDHPEQISDEMVKYMRYL